MLPSALDNHVPKIICVANSEIETLFEGGGNHSIIDRKILKIGG